MMQDEERAAFATAAMASRDHDAIMADRKEMDEEKAKRLVGVVERATEFKTNLRIKHPKMRETLKMLHSLTEFEEVDSELFAELVEECTLHPSRRLIESYERAAGACGKRRHNAKVAEQEAKVAACKTPEQVAAQQAKVDALVAQ